VAVADVPRAGHRRRLPFPADAGYLYASPLGERGHHVRMAEREQLLSELVHSNRIGKARERPGGVRRA